MSDLKETHPATPRKGLAGSSGCALWAVGAILGGCSATAAAQVSTPTASPAAGPLPTPVNAADRAPRTDDRDDIIVTARRGDAVVPPETELGADDIAAYGADTIAELLGVIAPLIDGSGRAPVLLVNGKRIGAAAGVTGFPPEALARLAILPPGAASRYGYPADQRVVNLVLKPKFASWDGSTGVTLATAGGRDSENGSVSRVVIDGATYWNAQLQLSRDSALRKSARPLTSPAALVDLAAHFAAPDGGEIDPALSRIVGRTVAVVDIPAMVSGHSPSLAALAAAAASNVRYDNPDDVDALLPGGRTLGINLGVTRPLGGFSLSLNTNFAVIGSIQQLGYPAQALHLPAGSPWSPFARDVLLIPALSGVISTARQDTATFGVSSTLAGSVAGWNVNLVANYTHSWSDSRFDRSGDLAAVQARIDAHDSTFNPYVALPRATLITTDRVQSQTRGLDVKVIVDKAVATLPAGPLTVNLATGGSHVAVGSDARDTANASLPGLRRTEINAQAGFTVPLTRRREGPGAVLGELSATVTAGMAGILGSTVQRQLDNALSWSPAATVQVFGDYSIAEDAPDVAQLNAPQTRTVVRLYDPVRQEVAAPIWLSGGNPNLRRGSRTNFVLKGAWRPLGGQGLTINLGYQRQIARGGATGFPQLTPAVEAAFPDRVMRNGAGQLIEIDARPVAIEQDDKAQLTAGFTLLWNLGRAVAPAQERQIRAGNWRFSVALIHHWQLESRLTIRADLPALDRLGGDGGQPRHLLSAQAVAGKRGMGVTLNGRWQSGVRIRNLAIAAGRGDNAYAALAQLDLDLFLEPATLFGARFDRGWAANTRLSINVQNMFDRFQRVTLADGTVPAGYDRYQLNPLGRTVQVTFRKHL